VWSKKRNNLSWPVPPKKARAPGEEKPAGSPGLTMTAGVTDQADPGAGVTQLSRRQSGETRSSTTTKSDAFELDSFTGQVFNKATGRS